MHFGYGKNGIAKKVSELPFLSSFNHLQASDGDNDGDARSGVLFT